MTRALGVRGRKFESCHPDQNLSKKGKMLDITICKNRDNEKYSLRNDKYEFWTGAY